MEEMISTPPPHTRTHPHTRGKKRNMGVYMGYRAEMILHGSAPFDPVYTNTIYIVPRHVKIKNHTHSKNYIKNTHISETQITDIHITHHIMSEDCV